MRKLIGRCLAVASTLILLCTWTQTANAQTTYTMPNNNSFKAWESYTKLKNRSSRQYKLQQQAETDSNGLRIYNNRYMVAVGTFFDSPVGTYIDVELSTGVVLPCVIGDIKADIHTDSLNLQTSNGNIVEFIVDTATLPDTVKSSGDVSKLSGFEGDVAKITVLNDYTPGGDSLVSPVTSVNQISTPSGDVTQLTYASTTDLNVMYVDEEVFTTTLPDTEVFVTYSDNEVTVE